MEKVTRAFPQNGGKGKGGYSIPSSGWRPYADARVQNSAISMTNQGGMVADSSFEATCQIDQAVAVSANSPPLMPATTVSKQTNRQTAKRPSFACDQQSAAGSADVPGGSRSAKSSAALSAHPTNSSSSSQMPSPNGISGASYDDFEESCEGLLRGLAEDDEDDNAELAIGKQLPISTEQLALASEDEIREITKRVPLNNKGQPTSVGSVNHSSGQCRVCVFHHSKFGCTHGVLCEFCHFRHKKKDKLRPCRGKRKRYKNMVEEIMEKIEENPEAVDIANIEVPATIMMTPGGKEKLIQKLQAYASNVLVTRQLDGSSRQPREDASEK
jgi:hypothetical protein